LESEEKKGKHGAERSCLICISLANLQEGKKDSSSNHRRRPNPKCKKPLFVSTWWKKRRGLKGGRKRFRG